MDIEEAEELAYNKPGETASSSASANIADISEEAPIKFDEYLLNIHSQELMSIIN